MVTNASAVLAYRVARQRFTIGAILVTIAVIAVLLGWRGRSCLSVANRSRGTPKTFSTVRWRNVSSRPEDAIRRGRPAAFPHDALEYRARGRPAVIARRSRRPGHLCQIYWYPLYAYVRRQGHSPDDAQDLTQEFFARLLEKNIAGKADRTRGKFRSFLLTSLNHFLAKEWRRRRRRKRGGGRVVLSLDLAAGEDRYNLEPAHELTAEKIYQRRWALTLLEQTLAKLRDEFAGQRQARAVRAPEAVPRRRRYARCPIGKSPRTWARPKARSK